MEHAGADLRLHVADFRDSALSVDGGPETYFDEYAATRSDNVFLFATPTLANMTHSFKGAGDRVEESCLD